MGVASMIDCHQVLLPFLHSAELVISFQWVCRLFICGSLDFLMACSCKLHASYILLIRYIYLLQFLILKMQDLSYLSELL